MVVCFLRSIVTLRFVSVVITFCSPDFVCGKVDSSTVLRQSSLSTHEPNFRRAEIIFEMVGLSDGASVFVPHGSFLSHDSKPIDEIITYVATSSDIVL
jgi:hypothetical protein